MKTIGVVTGARSDYGILLPVLRALQAADVKLWLYVTGMHLAPQFGNTVEQIARDGFPIHERIDTQLDADTPEGIARSMGLGVQGFAESFGRQKPDWLVLLGDRTEMLAAATAALPFNIPIAHIHGGERTEGAIDEAIRHSLTKMSHLHFVSTEPYARRVIQMGEPPERVTVTGAPSLDNLKTVRLLTLDELAEQRGLRLQKPFLLVTYHPVTLAGTSEQADLDEFFAALEAADFPVLFTYPNADANSHRIIEHIKEFVARQERSQLAVSLGTQGYFSAMSHAAAMVGNSSSGIIEAASFKLPVVNVGDRQLGRVSGRNVVHTGTSRAAILAGLKDALALNLADLSNPYGDGNAAGKIVKRLLAAGPELLRKTFYDLP